MTYIAMPDASLEFRNRPGAERRAKHLAFYFEERHRFRRSWVRSAAPVSALRCSWSGEWRSARTGRAPMSYFRLAPSSHEIKLRAGES